MEKKVKLSTPDMPDFIRYEIEGETSLRQDGFDPAKDNKISVGSLTVQEAEEYGELLKQTFITHWNKLSNQ
jgi:hypothetical protein